MRIFKAYLTEEELRECHIAIINIRAKLSVSKDNSGAKSIALRSLNTILIRLEKADFERSY